MSERKPDMNRISYTTLTGGVVHRESQVVDNPEIDHLKWRLLTWNRGLERKPDRTEGGRLFEVWGPKDQSGDVES